MAAPQLSAFLSPLDINVTQMHALAQSMATTLTKLAAESQNQFLSTPILESMLTPAIRKRGRRFLAIDIGGTNLRVGFIELLDQDQNDAEEQPWNGDVGSSRVRRHLEKSWPIGEQLKTDQASGLFLWAGKCIMEVVQDGCDTWPDGMPSPIPLGVTFSFPMVQYTLSEATLMPMGKGFAITSSLDLGAHLLKGYDTSRSSRVPPIKIVAITNDSVATLISLAYQHPPTPGRIPAMGLIVGTGSNATITLPLRLLHPSKRPSLPSVDSKLASRIQSEPDMNQVDLEHHLDSRIVINTEWSINGTYAPLHSHKLITPWDVTLDSQSSAPGFQPLEYMTAGRYMGELGRLILIDYFTSQLRIPHSGLPKNLRREYGLDTAFFGNLRERDGEEHIRRQLEREIPGIEGFWTSEKVYTVVAVAKAIQVRAAGITAASVIGLLICAGYLPLSSISSLPNLPLSPPLYSQSLPNDYSDTSAVSRKLISGTSTGEGRHRDTDQPIEETQLIIGYTGGTIVNFQNYLCDCQYFLDEILQAILDAQVSSDLFVTETNGKKDGREEIMEEKKGKSRQVRVVLLPCHDGGIIGAGILAGRVA